VEGTEHGRARARRDPHQAAADAARTAYERLLAFLSARSRDVAGAEDALADAFREALERWPVSGVPETPEAWLLTVARRRLVDAARRASTRRAADGELRAAYDEAVALTERPEAFPDDRLKLLFVCAHPAIAAEMHTPLMLQIVLGLDAARIGSAFLVPPATMGQRLVRAKAKIKDAGISFDIPANAELAPRIETVLSAVYAAYDVGRDFGIDAGPASMREEAVVLARLHARLLPNEPEVRGLLALVLHCEARAPASRAPDGAYVPLSDQDVRLWDHALLAEANEALREGSRAGRFGRFLFEAAIQSVHAQRAVTGTTDWAAVALLYGALLRVAPTVGAAVAEAAAVLQANGPTLALVRLDALHPGDVIAYQPYWAVRGAVLARAGRRTEARDAYERAIGLSTRAEVRAFLRAEQAALAPAR
jgi:RNA polymerase sigma-70 factor (ECF subfamily)